MYDFYIITALSAFYLIVFSTYLSFLFTCNIDNAIKNNQLIILILGYFLFFYLVTLTDKKYVSEHPIEKMLKTFMYYLLFLLTTRLEPKVILFVIILIFIINFLQINKEHYLELLKNKKEKEDIYWITLHNPIELKLFKVKKEQLEMLDNIENILYYVLISSIIIGFVSFYGELKYMKKDSNISYYRLLFDRNICKFRDGRSLIQNIKYALNIK